MNQNAFLSITPSLARVAESAQRKEYKMLPVALEILADFCTPIEALRILRGASQHAFLLESVAEHEKWGRYTFLGFQPKMSITCKDGKLWRDGSEIMTTDVLGYLRKLLAKYRSPKLPGLPPICWWINGHEHMDYRSK